MNLSYQDKLDLLDAIEKHARDLAWSGYDGYDSIKQARARVADLDRRLRADLDLPALPTAKGADQ